MKITLTAMNCVVAWIVVRACAGAGNPYPLVVEGLVFAWGLLSIWGIVSAIHGTPMFPSEKEYEAEGELWKRSRRRYDK